MFFVVTVLLMCYMMVPRNPRSGRADVRHEVLRMAGYDAAAIENKWQDYWEANGTFVLDYVY